MDYTGRGYITLPDLTPVMLTHKLNYSKEKIEEFVKQERYFEAAPHMEFDYFKKAFFPHLFQADVNETYGNRKDLLKIQPNEPEKDQNSKAVQRLRNVET